MIWLLCVSSTPQNRRHRHDTRQSRSSFIRRLLFLTFPILDSLFHQENEQQELKP